MLAYAVQINVSKMGMSLKKGAPVTYELLHARCFLTHTGGATISIKKSSCDVYVHIRRALVLALLLGALLVGLCDTIVGARKSGFTSLAVTAVRPNGDTNVIRIRR